MSGPEDPDPEPEQHRAPDLITGLSTEMAEGAGASANFPRRWIMNWKRFKARFFSDPTRVLALSGGGARGMAHIGVLEHLDSISIKPDLVTGT
ncbi:MAG: patatin-like phospholipase family protein, partial [Gemmatimonadota bacterium]